MSRLFVAERPDGGIHYITGTNSLSEARELHDHVTQWLGIPANKVGDSTYQRPDSTNVTYAERIRAPTAQETNEYWAREAMVVKNVEIETFALTQEQLDQASKESEVTDDPDTK